MSAKMLHVSFVLEQRLWVLAQQSQIVILGEVRELALRLVPCLRDLTGVYETMDVGRDPLISLEVGQAVDELVREEEYIICVCMYIVCAHIHVCMGEGEKVGEGDGEGGRWGKGKGRGSELEKRDEMYMCTCAMHRQRVGAR